MTKSLTRALTICGDRRKRQEAHNTKHGINPQTVRKAIGDILSVLRPSNTAPMPGKGRRKDHERDKVVRELRALPESELARLIMTLEEEMNMAAEELRFEYAARLRDEVKELKRELRDAH